MILSSLPAAEARQASRPHGADRPGTAWSIRPWRPLFAAAVPAFRDLLSAAGPIIATISAASPGGGPGLVGERPARFEQEWFPRLDAVAAYTLVRRTRPRRILEIGCGHSSRFMAQAIADGDLGTLIDLRRPAPPRSAGGAAAAPRVPRPSAMPMSRRPRASSPATSSSSIRATSSSPATRSTASCSTCCRGCRPAHWCISTISSCRMATRRPGSAVATTSRRRSAPCWAAGGYDLVFASRYVATRTGLLAGTFVEDLPLAARGARREPVAAQTRSVGGLNRQTAAIGGVAAAMSRPVIVLSLAKRCGRDFGPVTDSGRRRSNRPGNSQAKGPRRESTLERGAGFPIASAEGEAVRRSRVGNLSGTRDREGSGPEAASRPGSCTVILSRGASHEPHRRHRRRHHRHHHRLFAARPRLRRDGLRPSALCRDGNLLRQRRPALGQQRRSVELLADRASRA